MFNSLRQLIGRKPASAKKAKKAPRRTFRPMVDSLEDRRLMAVLFVDDNLQQFPTAPFTSIQAAVNAAAPGDTISVFAGKYNESVTIPATKPRLTINGTFAGPTFATNPQIAAIVDPPAVGSALGFNVLANDTVIRGFTIGDIDDNTVNAIGIRTDATISGFTISNNVIQDNTYGVYLHASGATASNVTSNWIRQNNDPGASSGNGIYSDQGARNISVVSNIISDQTSSAVNFAGAVGTQTNLRIQSNVIGEQARVGSGSTIVLFNSTNSNISYNLVYQSVGSGIFLGGGNVNTTVQGNTVNNSAGTGINVTTLLTGPNTSAQIVSNVVFASGQSGIRLQTGTTNSFVFGNTVSGSRGVVAGTGNGISLESALNNVVQSNSVTYNAANGILVTGASAGNSILYNVALFNGNGFTTFDLNEQGILFANFWFGNTALTRSRPGL